MTEDEWAQRIEAAEGLSPFAWLCLLQLAGILAWIMWMRYRNRGAVELDETPET